ncbi:MFS transporter [Anaeroselena agilis]|uniref:MFS transporter n=1 Tax=Anaeroselena agilis TaxID=3063788 RepID=A0ABU3P242_9FIRM|nr:MFS transporter [Selenomonadales bacterium 4137-cl]
MPPLPEWKKNLAALWFAQLAGMGAITGVMAFLPLYVRELGITDLAEAGVWSGLLMGAAPLTAALAGPFWGAVADRRGRKRMVERVMFAFFTVMVLMGFVASVNQLLFLRVIQGVFGGFTAAALALVTSLSPPDQITWTLGIFQTAMIAGSAFGPMFGGIIADHFGYRWAFVSFGLLCLISLVIIRLAVVERFTPAAATAKQPVWREIGSIITIPGLWLTLALQFLIQFAMMIIAPILPIYVHVLSPDLTYIASAAGAIIAAAGLTSAVASAAMGKISKRFSHRAILTVAGALSAICFAAQALADNVLLFGAMRAVSGFFLGAMLPTVNALTYFLIPEEKRGVAYGVTTASMQMGIVLGPISGGALAVYFGFPAVFWLSALLFAAVAVCVLLVRSLPDTGDDKPSA